MKSKKQPIWQPSFPSRCINSMASLCEVAFFILSDM